MYCFDILVLSNFSLRHFTLSFCFSVYVDVSFMSKIIIIIC